MEPTKWQVTAGDCEVNEFVGKDLGSGVVLKTAGTTWWGFE